MVDSCSMCKQQQQSSSWDQFKNLIKCKQMDIIISGSDQKIHPSNNGYSKLSSSCSSICSFKDVADGNSTTRIVHRADNSPESSTVSQDSGQHLRRKKHVNTSTTSSSNSNSAPSSARSIGNGSYTSSSRGMQFRKLSGCYECHAVVDPSRHTIPRSAICLCSECGEASIPKNGEFRTSSSS